MTSTRVPDQSKTIPTTYDEYKVYRDNLSYPRINPILINSASQEDRTSSIANLTKLIEKLNNQLTKFDEQCIKGDISCEREARQTRADKKKFSEILENLLFTPFKGGSKVNAHSNIIKSRKRSVRKRKNTKRNRKYRSQKASVA